MHRLGPRTLTLMVIGWLASVGGLRGDDKEDGFVPLFNGKDLKGWVVKGKAEGWQIRNGVIRSEGATGGDWIRSSVRCNTPRKSFCCLNWTTGSGQCGAPRRP